VESGDDDEEWIVVAGSGMVVHAEVNGTAK